MSDAAEKIAAARRILAEPARPPARTYPMWVLPAAGPALSFMISAVVVFIAAPRWPWLSLSPWPDAVAAERVAALASVAGLLVAILGVVVFRLASADLRRIEAKGAGGSLTIDTGAACDHGGRESDAR